MAYPFLTNIVARQNCALVFCVNEQKNSKTILHIKLLINDLYLPFSVHETLDLIRYNRSETLPNEDNFWTPLHYASKYDHWRVYELLIKHIENKNPQDINGRTPLHIAAQSGNIDVSRSMVA